MTKSLLADLGLIQQTSGYLDVVGEVTQEPSDHMSPRFLVACQVKGLHGLLRSLMRREAGPLVPARRCGVPRLLEVSLGLLVPLGKCGDIVSRER